MIPNSIKYRSHKNRTADHLFRNEGKDPIFTVGLSSPLLDIPIESATDRVAFEEKATIILTYSEIGVEYQLFAKDTAATDNNNSNPVSLIHQGNGEELKLMSDPITEDLDFIVKAVKKVSGIEIEKWMDTTVRITVGVDINIPVLLEEAEIDFGESARVILPSSQAGIAYRLYDQNNILLGGPVVGTEGQIVIQSFSQAGILEEDTILTVKAIRETESGNEQELANKPSLRVRANPQLILANTPEIIDYGSPLIVRIEESQASVTYSLYIRPLDELEFWHNQTATAPGPLISIPAQLPTPLPPDVIPFSDIEVLRPPVITNGQLPSHFEASGSSASGNGANLDLSTNNLTQDCMALILAEKNGHTQAVILSAVKIGLTRPKADVQINIDPNPVPAGNTTQIQLTNTEAGVRYFLLDSSDNLLGVSTFMPQTSSMVEGVLVSNSVGRLKIGVDFFSGPVPTEPLTMESPTISANTSLKILAIKNQTLLSALLTGPIDILTS